MKRLPINICCAHTEHGGGCDIPAWHTEGELTLSWFGTLIPAGNLRPPRPTSGTSLAGCSVLGVAGHPWLLGQPKVEVLEGSGLCSRAVGDL